jgi:hypothetical protein
VIPADDMLVAIGSRPNTEWLDRSGLTLNNGLVCDELSAPAPGVCGGGGHGPLVQPALQYADVHRAPPQRGRAGYVRRPQSARPAGTAPVRAC